MSIAMPSPRTAPALSGTALAALMLGLAGAAALLAGWAPLLFSIATVFLFAVAWLLPYHFSLALVYGHPLMALWLLDRELQRSRANWRPAYHLCLLALPFLLVVLWWKLWDAPPLPGGSDLFQAITGHAGA